eukprot:TRINITY_DN8413_c0_g2_i10.p1 TRINITY_DN8413_c0_g2~~TRINITY_DN8413_c0_g2_i10.p1  ORF type:complete len:189 (-),score=27.52 TRINITY_DN8413_c0_g2_i10:142-708(-)
MAWLHSRDPPVLHCDLYTNNILLTRHLKCKISDFGLSRVSGEMGNELSSTPYRHSKPPEIKSHKDFTRESDVFMFGLVMFELLFAKKIPTARIFKTWATPGYYQTLLGDRLKRIRTDWSVTEDSDDETVLDEMKIRKFYSEFGFGLYPNVEQNLFNFYLIIIHSCTNPQPRSRPLFETIIEQLESVLE